MKKNIATISVVLGFIVFIGIALITRLFNSEDLPIQISGALLEAVVTALITYFLLTGQTSQEKERDKDIRIFEEKVSVYSEFSEKLWGMITDNNEVSNNELVELRKLCFSKLVFYLNDDQIKNISKEIRDINKVVDKDIGRIAKITKILQENLQKGSNSLDKNSTKSSQNEDRQQLLSELFNSFNREEIRLNEEPVIVENGNIQSIHFWHFNLLGDEQIKAFENKNWVLALLEYGEEWRTNSVRQIKPNDVIFLFKRGGSGYIGAFKALDPTSEILYQKDKNGYSIDIINKFDIYKGLEDGASLCTNILVKPIAFNYKGVGYKTVRRRTIEKMYDTDAVNFLLNRFNGKDLNETQIKAKGKLNENTSIEKDLDQDFFNEIIKKVNL